MLTLSTRHFYLMQPRRGIFASPLPITSPSKRLNRKHSNTFTKCCCFKPTKLKVEPDEINQSKQKISSSPPPTTIRSWIYLILIIVVIQLITDYILLQTAFSTDLPKSPPHLSNSLHSSPLTNNKRSSPPKQSFLAEFYHHATPMTAQPITTVTYNTIDFQPTASTSSKKYRKDWTTPIPIIPPTTNPTIDHPIHPIDPSNPSNPSTPIPSPPSFPPQSINVNAFSVLFRGLFHFDAVQYRFVVASSDNVRLWIDDHLILDEFLHASSDPTPVVEKILITFPIKGLHQITVEYQKKKIVHGQTNQEQQRRSTNTMQSSKQPNSYKKNGKNFDKKYCLNLPISMNGEKHPRGCPGAVLDTGSPSQDYCLGGNGKYPWWKKCCVFDDGKCISKTTKSWDTIANQLLSTHLHVHWLPDPLGLKIYMYDLPPRFNQEIVETNVQCSSGHMFGAEIAIHTSLTNSVVRTYDPREADLFYVPVYTSCKYLGKPFFGIDPWFGKKMASKSVQYIQQEFPFWNKRNGQDHVFAMTYDYGACYEYKYSKANVAGVLRILNNAILLSTISDATVSCFRPSIDVPIPTWIDPTSAMAETLPRLKSDIDDGDDVITVMHSTVFDDIDIDDNTTVMMNDEKSNGNVDKRDWMVYFQGSKEWFDHDPEYSNGRILGGLRNYLFETYKNDDDFHLLEGKSINYVQNMRRSTFCLCPRGFAVWSPRIYESVLAGCIPVIMADSMHLPFSYTGSGIDWRTFSIMIPEKVVQSNTNVLKDLLLSLTEEDILLKQIELRRIRKTMLYIKPLNKIGGDQKDRVGDVGGVGGVEDLQGDAFENIVLALREKAKAMRFVSAKHGPGFWL